ncbi:hypothetical protein EPO56_01330 [Patescibacteria group bacterium]|nr:MAG: hypothetical protein EPO56_01330 [Patescibacteria group bacterium]
MGSAKGDLLVVILLITALGVAWVWTGGPSRSISHSSGFLNAPWPIGAGGDAYIVPRIDTSFTPADGVNYEAKKQETPQEKKSNLLDYFFGYRPGLGKAVDLPPSPYAQYVYLERSQAGATNPREEYVTIKTSSSLKQSITITGWKLESAVSNLSMTIGAAAEIPFLGGTNYESPIVLGPNSEVVVVTGSSPNGTSFRLNQCTGYFEQFQDFSPALKKECPKPEDEMLLYPEKTAANQMCQDFIAKIPRCTLTLTAIPGNVGEQCQNFILNDLSYNGCIAKHQNESDFYKNEWRVFLKREQELWQNKHERILLIDENGKLVAQVSY